jgi:GRAM domain
MTFDLMDGERLLAEELANLFRGWEGVGGRLYITNRRLRFEAHALNIQRGATDIPWEDIADVRPRNNLWIIPNGMEIETRDGVCYRFVVWGRKRLIDMIQVCKSGAVWGSEDQPDPGRAVQPPADPSIVPGSSVDGTAHKKGK